MPDPADLQRLLIRRGPHGAAELRAALSVSPATLARLVAAAGERVLRFGRARSTRYAATRVIEGVGTSAPLFRVGPGGAPAAAGRLHFLAGGATLLDDGERPALFVGLPPALADMAPQGYLGHRFAARHPALGLPPRVTDWSDDHRLCAMARRGEDLVGDLLVGDESLARFLAWTPAEVGPTDYPALAERSALDPAGSSAGGERPKFGALLAGRHVLVKFAAPGDSPAARRWRTLAWCEWRALALLAEAGLPAAAATVREVGGWRFLEAERFDRVGRRGRQAVVTLGALDDEHFGRRDSWTAASLRLPARPFSLPPADAARIRWVDAFGQLIGNTDRHFGNLAFFLRPDGALRLAPVYDMLPMILAPAGELVVDRPLEPAPPAAGALAEWRAAAPWAARYWDALAAEGALEAPVRAYARGAAAAVRALAERVGG